MTRRYRHWTMFDVNRLLALKRSGVSTNEIAERLGRNRSDCTRQWRKFGNPARRQPMTDADREEVRRLNALGLTDPEVAQRLRRPLSTVFSARREMGLPSNRHGARHREKLRVAYYAACRSLGVRSMGQVSAELRAAAAARRGWPDARSEAEADVLDVLAARPGGVSAQEVARALGYSLYGWASGARRVLTRLASRGLAVRVGRRPGKTCSEVLYALAPGVEKGRSVGRRGGPKEPRAQAREMNP